MEVHVKDNLESVSLTTKLLIIDPSSTSPPLLLIITGPKHKIFLHMYARMQIFRTYVCMYIHTCTILKLVNQLE